MFEIKERNSLEELSEIGYGTAEVEDDEGTKFLILICSFNGLIHFAFDTGEMKFFMAESDHAFPNYVPPVIDLSL